MRLQLLAGEVQALRATEAELRTAASEARAGELAARSMLEEATVSEEKLRAQVQAMKWSLQEAGAYKLHEAMGRLVTANEQQAAKLRGAATRAQEEARDLREQCVREGEARAAAQAELAAQEQRWRAELSQAAREQQLAAREQQLEREAAIRGTMAEQEEQVVQLQRQLAESRQQLEQAQATHQLQLQAAQYQQQQQFAVHGSPPPPPPPPRYGQLQQPQAAHAAIEVLKKQLQEANTDGAVCRIVFLLRNNHVLSVSTALRRWHQACSVERLREVEEVNAGQRSLEAQREAAAAGSRTAAAAIQNTYRRRASRIELGRRRENRNQQVESEHAATRIQSRIRSRAARRSVVTLKQEQQTPCCRLALELVGAAIASAGVTAPDPYVVLRWRGSGLVGERERRSAVRRRTTQPRWSADDIFVFDLCADTKPGAQLELAIHSWDLGGHDRLLCEGRLVLSEMISGRVMRCPLFEQQGGQGGVLTIRVQFAVIATPPKWLAQLLEEKELADAATKLQAQMRGRTMRQSMVASAPLSRPDTSQSWQQAQPNATGVQDEAALLATIGVGSEEELSAEWAAAEAEAIAVLHKGMTKMHLIDAFWAWRLAHSYSEQQVADHARTRPYAY